MLRRHSIRLKNFDYTTNGAYFVIICTHQRQSTLGDIIDGQMFLSNIGKIVSTTWQKMPEHFSFVICDSFVIMPNHIHTIIIISNVGAQYIAPLHTPPNEPVDNLPTHRVVPQSLGAIVRIFKAAATREARPWMQGSVTSIWQRNYYAHIIRSETSLNQLRLYIEHNPSNWIQDKLFTSA